MSALRCSRGVYPLLPFFVPRFRTQVQGPRIQLGQASNHPTGRVFLKVGPPKNMKAWLPFGCPKATNPKKGVPTPTKQPPPATFAGSSHAPCGAFASASASALAAASHWSRALRSGSPIRLLVLACSVFFFVFCCSVFLPLFFLSFCLCLFLSFFVFPSFGLCLSGFLAACLSVGLSSTN